MSNAGEVRVALVRSTYKNVFEQVRKSLELIQYRPRKDRIFIKPNLVGSFSADSGFITHPAVVEALVRIFREYFPRGEIVVGDGCAVHEHWERVLKKSGYRYLTERYGVQIVSLDEVERKDYSWAHGTLELPELLDTHEYINVAKMKTHCQASVSLCMKNQKGLLRKKNKQNFHRKDDLHDSIRFLTQAVKPDLSVIDGIHSLEGNGPLPPGTKRKGPNLIIASQDIYAADNVGARVMGFNVSDIPHIPEFTDYSVVGEDLEANVIPFKKPDPSPWVKNNVYFHFDETACSLCSVSASVAYGPSLSNLPFIVRLMAIGGMSIRKDVIMGAIPYSSNGGDGHVLCLGDCAAKLAKKNGFTFVRGCPPKISDLRTGYLDFCKNAKKAPQ
ncbi:MAG: DUF362 domain-containing protein [Deltaproteobacteria bacterium]|nr:DUF362 domain-containing protein [Deltaproteobacteria bacterium]